MADIVQLEEKGTVLYPKTHTKAIDDLDNVVVKKTGNETIEGTKNFKTAIQINGKSLLDMFYPIGSIFQSVSSVSPASTMGGTWERIKGKVLVGVDEADSDFVVGKTGGEKKHKLTIAEIPSHSHALQLNKGISPASVSSGGSNGYLWGEYSGKNSSSVGGDESHNNLQPYMTAFIWKRTA